MSLNGRSTPTLPPDKNKHRRLIVALSVIGAAVAFYLFCASMGWIVAEEVDSSGADSGSAPQSAAVSAPMPTSTPKPPVSVSLPTSEPAPIPTQEEANRQFIEIREAYENNELSADDKYKGNRYVIYAYLNGITEDGLINLFGGITAAVEMRINGTLYFAYCTFGEESRDALAALNKGDLMIIEGECLSWGQWADCILLP